MGTLCFQRYQNGWEVACLVSDLAVTNNDCREGWRAGGLEGWRESYGLCAVKIRIRNLQNLKSTQNPLFKNIVTSTSLGNGDERTQLGSSAEHDMAKWTTGSTHQLKPQQSEKT